MSISGPDFRSKNHQAEMELFTMAFVKKYSKDVEYLIDNIDIFFREIDFWEFYIFLCPAHNMKFFKEDVQTPKKLP